MLYFRFAVKSNLWSLLCLHNRVVSARSCIFWYWTTVLLFQWKKGATSVGSNFILYKFSYGSGWSAHFYFFVLLQNRVPLANFILNYWNFDISLCFAKWPNRFFIIAVSMIGIMCKFSYGKFDWKSEITFFFPGHWWKSISWGFALAERFVEFGCVCIKMLNWLTIVVKGLIA